MDCASSLISMPLERWLTKRAGCSFAKNASNRIVDNRDRNSSERHRLFHQYSEMLKARCSL